MPESTSRAVRRALVPCAALLLMGAAPSMFDTLVPQLHRDDAWALYRAMDEQTLALPATTLLLCEVSVPRYRYDAFAGADLRVELLINGVPAGAANGPEDVDTALVSFPIAVSAGESLTLKVYDRDLTGFETVGSGTATLGRELPVTFKKAVFGASCRGVPEAMTLLRQDEVRGRIDAALAALGPLPKVRLTEEGLGRPAAAFAELDKALEAAGVWYRAGGPALAERRRRAQELPKRWSEAVAAEVADAVQRLPPATAPVLLQEGVVRATVGALRCTPQACTLGLELENLSDTPLERATNEVPQEAFVEAQLVMASGALVPFRLENALRQADGGAGFAPVQPNGRLALKLLTYAVLRGSEGPPKLLRVRTPFGYVLLRLRAP